MEQIGELTHLSIAALLQTSVLLDQWFHIPWPIPIATLFLPILATLDAWCLRGFVFPAPCAYQTTAKGWCKRGTVGEWHRCWQHSKLWTRKADGILVDPDLRRWQIKTADGRTVDAKDLAGRGFLSLHSLRDTLLYRKGFVRPPRDVFNLLPEVINDHWKKVKQRFRGLQKIGWRGIFINSSPGAHFAVSSNLPSVIWATRVVLILSVPSLIAVILSKVMPQAAPTLEYLATYGFITSISIVRIGIWQEDPNWPIQATIQALKWILSLTLIMTFTGLVSLYTHQIVEWEGLLTTSLTTILALLILTYFVYLFEGQRHPRSWFRKAYKRGSRRR